MSLISTQHLLPKPQPSFTLDCVDGEEATYRKEGSAPQAPASQFLGQRPSIYMKLAKCMSVLIFILERDKSWEEKAPLEDLQLEINFANHGKKATLRCLSVKGSKPKGKSEGRTLVIGLMGTGLHLRACAAFPGT